MGSEIRLLSGNTPIQSAVLADPRQRRILALVLKQSGSISERDLASQLAAREAEESLAAVTEQAHQRIQIALAHRCLPELEAAGWIERRPAGIVMAEQLSVEWIEESLPALEDPAVPWDALAALLAHSRRQHIMSIIVDHTPPLTLDELGTALRDFEQASRTRGEADDESTLLTTLHHVDLPILEEVGLIEYDSAEKTITRYRTLEALLDQIDIDSNTNGATDTNSEASL